MYCPDLAGVVYVRGMHKFELHYEFKLHHKFDPHHKLKLHQKFQTFRKKKTFLFRKLSSVQHSTVSVLDAHVMRMNQGVLTLRYDDLLPLLGDPVRQIRPSSADLVGHDFPLLLRPPDGLRALVLLGALPPVSRRLLHRQHPSGEEKLHGDLHANVPVAALNLMKSIRT